MGRSGRESWERAGNAWLGSEGAPMYALIIMKAGNDGCETLVNDRSWWDEMLKRGEKIKGELRR